KDVRMALVSGRPISFQMDLYTPLYVPRPTVVPELFASLRPVTYNDDLTRSRSEATAGLYAPPPAPTAAFGAQPPGESLALDKAPRDEQFAGKLQEQLREKMKLGESGVSTMATATKLGDFFQYAID